MIIHADCVTAMQAMESDSVDAVIADPPYGIGFMGKEWDGAGDGRSWATMGGPSGSDNTKHSERGGAMHAGKYDLSVIANRRFQDWCLTWATEALRVLKPGGHLLAFGGTRTYHRLACAVEDAGFEIRDSLIWVYGSGFPKSLDVSKAIDKAAGAEREVVGEYEVTRDLARNGRTGDEAISPVPVVGTTVPVTAPATPEAQHWQGWGTALKPSHEPIVVARKPLVGTVAANVLEHGTGALNIDGCRIEGVKRTPNFVTPEKETFEPTSYGMRGHTEVDTTQGRWPPNVTLSHLPECNSTCAEGCPVAELDRQSGEQMHSAGAARDAVDGSHSGPSGLFGLGEAAMRYGDTGGASRFFYVAKASRAERNAGCESFDKKPLNWSSGEQNPGSFQAEGTEKAARNAHPTVKPIALMRWLVRLVTPKGGTVLDPFTGSGSTGVAAVLEGFDFVGIEREAEYVALAEARVAFWAQFPGADVDKVLLSDAKAREIEASGQLGLL